MIPLSLRFLILPPKELSVETMATLASETAKGIFEQYRKDCARENCRYAMDFKPGILPLLAKDGARDQKVPKAQRDAFAAMVISSFNILEKQCA